MEEECCQVKVTELDNGYRFEITGKDIKGKYNCWEIFQKCCEKQQKTSNSDACC